MNTNRIRGVATCLRDYLQVDSGYMAERSTTSIISTGYYLMYRGAIDLPIVFWVTATKHTRLQADLQFPISPHWCGISNT